MSGIGTLGEMSLHAALKQWLARPGDELEREIDGYIIDLVREDLLLEIQTANFSAIKRKLGKLLAEHRLRLVHPIARERWICRVTTGGRQVGRRKSPKRGRMEEVFSQLVSIPHLANRPNFSLQVLLTQEEVVWRDDGRGSWRRKGWSVADRRLLEVVDSVTLETAADYLDFIPAGLPRPFTNQDLTGALNARPQLAQQMTYSLRHMGLLALVGKQGRYNLYQETSL
jgi:hypothetical protein